MRVTTFLVNSFTANGQGGNPAGVVLDAEHLSRAQKLHIARELGYSETAFVCADDEVDVNVSFFTPTDEVDFCGHATLAAFSVMYQEGRLAPGHYVQRTKAGLLPVVIEPDGRVVMQQQLPKYLGAFSYQEIAPLIGLSAEVLARTALPIEVISTGLADVLVPVPFGYLDDINPDHPLLADFCAQHNLVGLHAFELNEQSSEFTAGCRNFAPLFGIPEESATGSSSGALACYLAQHLPHLAPYKYVFEQGRAMNCASQICATVACQDGNITQVKVGGVAQQFGKRSIHL
ncbi:PhzF family phenazine biosynthesis protein [Pseudoalteromonas sp. T1lg75]|uniref:PhzF family phenazine biosynthesis protein n=1 Tax=Pseudoalteromonas sp. T1lg75 TaxID=2077102 RepID=UPI000CF5EF42|nr:PhzF family phenazine biosynthesis protein [Pseudoalteromonas sp. T1lg75]